MQLIRRPKSLSGRFASRAENALNISRLMASMALAFMLTLASGCMVAEPVRPTEAKASTRAPNILLIVVDDLGWRDMGHAGSEYYETPAIDRLASDGLRFINAYAAYPRCVPSRYALMTGRNPARAAIPGGTGGEVMAPEETTIAEAFQSAGYATFFAGKWHLGHDPSTFPEGQGFDVNIGGGSAGAVRSHFFPYGAEQRGRIGPGLEHGEPGEYLSDRLTDETIAFISRQTLDYPQQPFFAVLSHYAVHTPLQGKPDLVDHFTAKLDRMGRPTGPATVARDGQTKVYQDDPTYAAMIFSIDESVGRLRAKLEELGIAEDTIIVFTSDHGGLSNSGDGRNRRLATSNLPLRAGKGHVFEGGVKIPLLIAWPGHIGTGGTSKAVVDNTDLFPTFLALAGMDLMPSAHLDGRAIALVPGETMGERILYWHSPRPRPESTGDRAASAIREGRWKYVLSYDPQQTGGLFDLAADPGETRDRSADHPEIAAKLRKRLLAWLSETDAITPTLDRRGREAAPDLSLLTQRRGKGGSDK